MQKLGPRTITIDADVIQADGSTRCVSICGAYVALSIAVEKLIQRGLIDDNPIIEPIAAVSAGICDGEVIVDLDYAEDSHAQVDSNIVMTKSGKIIEFQTTAEGEPYDRVQLNEILDLASQSIDKIINFHYNNSCC